MLRCPYCRCLPWTDGAHGCDCGTEGMISGGHYHWCVTYGCHLCDDRPWGPWRGRWWGNLITWDLPHLWFKALALVRDDRRDR